MSFRLVGVALLAQWYEVELDAERQALMDEWLADLPMDSDRASESSAHAGHRDRPAPKFARVEC